MAAFLTTVTLLVEPPVELAAALAGDNPAREAYGALSSTHQKEYAGGAALK